MLAAIGIAGEVIDAQIDLHNSPLATAVSEGLLSGSLTSSATSNPVVRDLLLQIPISTSTAIDAALLSDIFSPGQLSVMLTIEGQLEATGTIAAVPEPPATIPAMVALLALAAIAWRATACRGVESK